MANETSLTRTYDDVLSQTRDAIGPGISDNITSRRPYLNWLNTVAKVMQSGGEQLHFNILKELGSGKVYTRGGSLNTSEDENLTRAAYEWTNYAKQVTLYGPDMAKNTSPEQIEDLVSSKIEAAILAAAEDVGGSVVGVFGTATESSFATNFTGLQALVSTTPTTGTIGNINRANVAAFRNQQNEVTTGFTTDGLASMRALWQACRFGNMAQPDAIVFNTATFLNYWATLQATLSYNLPSVPATAKQLTLDHGFNTISWFGVELFEDDACPAQRGYFLNSDYLHWKVHSMRDFELGPFVQPRDGDELTAQIFLMAQQVVSGMRYQGVLHGLPDTAA